MSDPNLKVSANFLAHEVLPPELFSNANVDARWFLTSFLVNVPQFFRDHFGKPVIVNNWKNGGQYKNSGFRLPECTEGAKLSQHRFGNAVDIKIEGLHPQEILEEVMKNKAKFPLITTYERIADTPTWNHFDGRDTGLSTLLEVPGK